VTCHVQPDSLHLQRFGPNKVATRNVRHSKYHRNATAGPAPPQTRLWELTTLPILLDLGEPVFVGRDKGQEKGGEEMERRKELTE